MKQSGAWQIPYTFQTIQSIFISWFILKSDLIRNLFWVIPKPFPQPNPPVPMSPSDHKCWSWLIVIFKCLLFWIKTNLYVPLLSVHQVSSFTFSWSATPHFGMTTRPGCTIRLNPALMRFVVAAFLKKCCLKWTGGWSFHWFRVALPFQDIEFVNWCMYFNSNKIVLWIQVPNFELRWLY